MTLWSRLQKRAIIIPGIINGGEWIAQRLHFLHDLLETAELTEAQRRAIEAEIEQLQAEQGIGCTGPGVTRDWRAGVKLAAAAIRTRLSR